MDPRTRLVLTAGACIIVFSLLGFILWRQGKPEVRTVTDIPLDERPVYWQERISAVGGARAYLELAYSMQGLTSAQKHFNTHIFGKALYETEGMAGTTVCDGQFSYGCFHAFMIRAVEDKGINAAQELHTACNETLGQTAEQCTHGIGHGLLGTIGYGMQDIEESLSICDTLTPPSHLVGGCAGGVFMEYGLRGMQGAGVRAHRPFVAAEALEPCMSLKSEKYRSACAYFQAMWWMETDPERSNDELMAQKMGDWCEQMPGERAVLTSCIAGVANRMQLLTDEDPLGVHAMCGLITPDEPLRFYCQLKSAMRYTVYYPLDTSLLACEGMTPERVEACKTQATADSAARRADQAKYEPSESHPDSGLE